MMEKCSKNIYIYYCIIKKAYILYYQIHLHYSLNKMDNNNYNSYSTEILDHNNCNYNCIENHMERNLRIVPQYVNMNNHFEKHMLEKIKQLLKLLIAIIALFIFVCLFILY